MDFFPNSWADIFAVTTPVLELIVRGTVVYFAVIALMRVLPRVGGDLAVIDLVFILLIANAAASGMGEHKTVGDAMLMLATLMGWNYLFNILSFHIPFVERLVSGSPVQIVRDGRLLRRNMRREYLTEEELMSQLRWQGIDKIEDVKAAYIEGDGQLSVIPRNPPAR